MDEGESLGSTESLWPDEGEGPWTVRVWWAHVGGRAEPVGFGAWKGCYLEGNAIQPLHELGPEPILAGGLRTLPFAQIVARLRDKQAEKWERSGALSRAVAERIAPEQSTPDRAQAADHMKAFLSAVEATARPFERKVRERHPPAYWKAVGEIYTEAWKKGQNPTKRVQLALGLKSYSTAAKYVVRARAEGHLGDVTQGRSGGILTPGTAKRGRPRKAPKTKGDPA